MMWSLLVYVSAGVLDGIDLSVIPPEAAVIAPADYVPVPDEQRAHHGIGTGPSQPPPRQAQRLSHAGFVVQDRLHLASAVTGLASGRPL